MGVADEASDSIRYGTIVLVAHHKLQEWRNARDQRERETGTGAMNGRSGIEATGNGGTRDADSAQRSTVAQPGVCGSVGCIEGGEHEGVGSSGGAYIGSTQCQLCINEGRGCLGGNTAGSTDCSCICGCEGGVGEYQCQCQCHGLVCKHREGTLKTNLMGGSPTIETRVDTCSIPCSRIGIG